MVTSSLKLLYLLDISVFKGLLQYKCFLVVFVGFKELQWYFLHLMDIDAVAGFLCFLSHLVTVNDVGDIFKGTLLVILHLACSCHVCDAHIC